MVSRYATGSIDAGNNALNRIKGLLQRRPGSVAEFGTPALRNVVLADRKSTRLNSSHRL